MFEKTQNNLMRLKHGKYQGKKRTHLSINDTIFYSVTEYKNEGSELKEKLHKKSTLKC